MRSAKLTYCVSSEASERDVGSFTLTFTEDRQCVSVEFGELEFCDAKTVGCFVTLIDQRRLRDDLEFAFNHEARERDPMSVAKERDEERMLQGRRA